MNKKHQEINTLKEFADLAGNETTIWKLLIGVTVEKISHFNNILLANQNDELIGKVSSIITIVMNKFVISVVFHNPNGISVLDYTKKNLIHNFELLSPILLTEEQMLSHLNRLLESYNFREADKFYDLRCNDYISHKKYLSQKQEFFDKQRNALVKSLHKLFEEYKFKEADRFYKSHCQGYISHKNDYCLKKIILFL